MAEPASMKKPVRLWGGRHVNCRSISFVSRGSGGCRPGILTINANTSDPAPRAAWAEAVRHFQAENPDVEVRFNIYDHESYKRSLRNWLTGGSPDVVFWFVGRRMREFVEPGLLEDVSDLYTPERKASLHPGALELVSVAGRQYGVPYAFYNVGLFFRRDLLERAGLAVPRDWTGLLTLCERLTESGVIPVAIGSKDLWPTAAWFDYLNLRTNGYAFHMDLMAGRVSYTDRRVRAVFTLWRELLDRKCFITNHASISWQESQSFLYQGRAAMMLIGSYIVPNFPADLRDQMGFAPFPVLDPTVAPAEDAPMNALHIPARARNKADARRFLAFMLRADVQAALNRKLVTIPVNVHAGIPDDRFLQAGAALLNRAEHLSQFFDRDTSEDLATTAMKGFQEFMLHPDRLDTVLQTIERARLRIYKP
jgi:multiple sugar transport system substrate-binding protein